MEKYEVISNGVPCYSGEPDIIVKASDEYTTYIQIKLPNGQLFNITVSPDYIDKPCITYDLK